MAKDEAPWLYINDSDVIKDADGKVTGKTSLAAATIMAPGWAHWSIGALVKKDGKEVREWDDKTFGVYPLPGNDGKPAPVFAGGSNIGISAASKNQEGARELMKIIFSHEYQQMLGKNGLGPANSEDVSALGTDEFAKALIDSASNSKLTPAAPGWAGVEASGKLEEFFAKVADGGDIAALAGEYDAALTPLLNVK
jgi:N,N'-diacetylchitobiose transport system substrate-binding protein